MDLTTYWGAQPISAISAVRSKLAFDQSYYYREPCQLHGCRQSQSNCLPRLWTPCSS